MTEPATNEKHHAHPSPGSAPSSFSARYPWLMAHDLWLLAWGGFSLFILMASLGRGGPGLEWLLVIAVAVIGSIVHALLLLIGWLSTSFRTSRPSFRHPLENRVHLVWILIWLSWIVCSGFEKREFYAAETFFFTMIGGFILATFGHLAVANGMSFLQFGRSADDTQVPRPDWTPVVLTEPAGPAGFCPSCGQARSGEFRFCVECGEELPPLDAAPTAAVPAPPEEEGADFLEITIRPQTIVLLIILAILLVIYSVVG